MASRYLTLAEIGGECALGEPLELARVRMQRPQLALVLSGNRGFVALRREAGSVGVRSIDDKGAALADEVRVELPGAGPIGLHLHALGVDVFSATTGCPEIEGSCFAVSRLDARGNALASPSYVDLGAESHEFVGVLDLEDDFVIGITDGELGRLLRVHPTPAELFELTPTAAPMQDADLLALVDDEALLLSGIKTAHQGQPNTTILLGGDGLVPIRGLPQRHTLIGAEHEGSIALLFKRTIVRDDLAAAPIPRGDARLARIRKDGFAEILPAIPNSFASRVFASLTADAEHGLVFQRQSGAGVALADITLAEPGHDLVYANLVRSGNDFVVLFAEGVEGADGRFRVKSRRVRCTGLTSGTGAGDH